MNLLPRSKKIFRVSKMFSLGSHAIFLSILMLSCFLTWRYAMARLPQEEVDALQQITKTMGTVYWKFNADSCQVEMVGLTLNPPDNSKANISCDCSIDNNTCHIVAIEIKSFSLPGILPPELVKLPYLQRVDFAYNYLNGSIPVEWASMQLKYISVLANRLSGKIPEELGNFTSLTYLDLEANQFFGAVPSELGKLVNIKTLFLSSNRLSGNLPKELAELSLRDFRINYNNFDGTIPDFIQNWTQLDRLEMHASGLKGPIPSSISVLEKLTQLRISDINGSTQDFPVLGNMTGLRWLVLRSCNISGEIPEYILQMNYLELLDLSFNNLVGEIPSVIPSYTLIMIFLSGNFLSGNLPNSILKKGAIVDLSYNNLMRQNPEQPACQENRALYLNLFRSSSMENNLWGVLPCVKDVKCPRYWYSLYVNCGGGTVKFNNNVYEGDARIDGGAARFFLDNKTNWGFSSTGDFMDDSDYIDKDYTANLQSSDIPELYTTARRSPLSLTYYKYCLENGSYTVSLHFAEIQFTNDTTYSSLGRRIFDIYIQDKLVQKDFNIADEAPGFVRPLTKQFNATVTNNKLEIQFFWAGKGTTRIPVRGVYGPLISAISVDPNFKPHSQDERKRIEPIVAGVVGLSLIFLAFGFLWWRSYLGAKSRREKDLRGLDLQTSSFTLKQIRAATDNFDSVNKIGEGGFGPVYKGQLSDGTVIAVKQLSSKSSQGNREFLNEIGMISCLRHPNLVKLYGYCIEGDQLLLIYEYLENNSLAHSLFGLENCQVKLDWPTRHKICVGIAKGLAFLHEDSRLKIVHRDIKATNVLLDRDQNPKISDFGLAKLYEDQKTHISTRIAGTIGYMAPEYALWGYLTCKADVYSFGIVALEIVSGKHKMTYGPGDNCACLLDWASHLQQSGNVADLVDQKLGSEFNKIDAERIVQVALSCTNASPALRPNMSEVVSMLEGTTNIPDVIPGAHSYSEVLRFKAMRDHQKQTRSQNLGGSQAHFSTSVQSWTGSCSTSAHDPYHSNMDSYLMEGQPLEGSQTHSLIDSSSAHHLHAINLESK